MLENVETVTASESPATEAQLAAHESVDELAHEQISQTEDEDYKWLTDRLDALSASQSTLASRLAEIQTANESKLEALTLAMRQNQEQSRTLIAAQAEMITSLLSSVTSLSGASLLVSSRSTQEASESSSQEAVPIVEEIVPENAVPEQTRESQGEPANGKKRRRI